MLYTCLYIHMIILVVFAFDLWMHLQAHGMAGDDGLRKSPVWDSKRLNTDSHAVSCEDDFSFESIKLGC